MVDRVYVGSTATRPSFGGTRTLVTGVPVRTPISLAGTHRQARPVASAHLLVTGGSLGSPFLNQHAAELLRGLAAHGVVLDVLHQAGTSDLEAVRRTYAQAGVSARVTPYIDDMADAYAWADFAVCSAGAGTLAELAASGLPALLVPFSGASEDHQVVNARVFAAASGGWWVREADWCPAVLAAGIADLLAHADAWAAASQRLLRLARTDAASVIVADCEAAMGGRTAIAEAISG